MNEQVKFIAIYGSIKLEQENRVEGNDLVCYGRRLEYGRDGVLTKIGAWSPLSRVIDYKYLDAETKALFR